MDINITASCTVLFVLLDVVITTVLYTHGSQLIIFKEDALYFNILLSQLDLWGIVLLRASLLLGASIGVLWNKGCGPQRVTAFAIPILLICLLIITYAMSKLLMLTEVDSVTHQPWLLSLICWTCASSLGVILLWRLLGKKPNSVSGHNSSSNGGGVGSEDTERLVGASSKDEDEDEVGSERWKQEESGGQEKDNPSSRATLGHLLSYCRKDAQLLSVAVLFLLIAAVCE